MNSKEDTRFIPLVSILLLSGTLAFVLGGFGFRLAAFGVVLLGLIASYLFLSSSEDEPESKACKPTDPGPVIPPAALPETRNTPNAPAHSAPAPPGNRRSTSHEGEGRAMRQ